MVQLQITPQQIKEIDKQYQYQFDLFEDNIEAQKAKWALAKLSIPDRIIFELYAEMQSSRKVGNILGVSHNVVLSEVRRIRAVIIEYMSKYRE